MSSSKSVNVPVDPKVKERDVNAKLQLYGIYSGTWHLFISTQPAEQRAALACLESSPELLNCPRGGTRENYENVPETRN
jgi:hypothetical protein